MAPTVACDESTGPADVPQAIDAGPARTAGMGEYVTLDGTSLCTSGLSCSWRQIAGPDVTEGTGTLAGQVTGFTAPPVVTAVNFELRVGNGADLSPPDTVVVLILADGRRRQ